jgi:hypothetical protein
VTFIETSLADRPARLDSGGIRTGAISRGRDFAKAPADPQGRRAPTGAVFRDYSRDGDAGQATLTGP